MLCIFIGQMDCHTHIRATFMSLDCTTRFGFYKCVNVHGNDLYGYWSNVSQPKITSHPLFTESTVIENWQNSHRLCMLNLIKLNRISMDIDCFISISSGNSLCLAIKFLVEWVILMLVFFFLHHFRRRLLEFEGKVVLAYKKKCCDFIA